MAPSSCPLATYEIAAGLSLKPVSLRRGPPTCLDTSFHLLMASYRPLRLSIILPCRTGCRTGSITLGFGLAGGFMLASESRDKIESRSIPA